MHGAAHGFVAGRSIVTNALAHKGADVVVKMDIKDFFPSVLYPRVKGVFAKLGYSVTIFESQLIPGGRFDVTDDDGIPREMYHGNLVGDIAMFARKEGAGGAVFYDNAVEVEAAS